MTSGIYCFKHNLKPFIYIGSSRNIESRYEQHLQNFLNNSHHNLALQDDYLNEEITFEILAKEIPKKDLIRTEQKYCVHFLNKGYLLYNSVMPMATKYDKRMLCSKQFYENRVTYVDNAYKNHIIRNQDKKLRECFEQIYNLTRENTVLKNQLGPNYKPNIFIELLKEEV